MIDFIEIIQLIYFSRLFQTFDEWNKGTLDSFLIEITADILRFKENGKYVLDTIRDAAGQVISLAFYEEFSFWFFLERYWKMDRYC